MFILYISVFFKLINFMLHVVSCHIVLHLYNIHTNSNLKFFITYLMCIFCKSRLMYQSICVFVHYYHVLYCTIFHAYDMEQFFMFQQFTIMRYHIQYIYHIVCISFLSYISLCSSTFKVYSEHITYISKYISMYNCLITSNINV